MYSDEIKLLKEYLVEEYVGYEDKKEMIERMDFNHINDFYVDVTEQLNLMNDPHLRVIDKLSQKKVTILCKSYENRLFVEKSIHLEISKGDEIIALGELTVPEVIEKEQVLLFDPNPERYEWHNVLRKYKYVTLKNDERKEIFIESPKELFDSEYLIEKRKDYCFIRLPDFKDVVALHKVIEENRELLTKSKKFIIDVRDNRGGSDYAYFPLFEFVFPPNYKLDIDYVYSFNYTKRYCDYMIERVDADLAEMTEGDTKEAFTAYRNRMSDNYAKGMVKFSNDIEPVIIDGIAEDIKVIVIANERCGSSGDNFVDTIKKNKFVTVIGRATKGMNDYANCGHLPLNEEYELLCPYSRDNGLDDGVSMALKGIMPHVEISWTPEELERDVLMEKAEELLTQ